MSNPRLADRLSLCRGAKASSLSSAVEGVLGLRPPGSYTALDERFGLAPVHAKLETRPPDVDLGAGHSTTRRQPALVLGEAT